MTDAILPIPERSRSMAPHTALAAAALALALTLPLAGCSSSVRLSSKKMCEGTGGTYVGNTCNPAAPNSRTAAQMCQAQDGVYIEALDMCEIAGASK